jgi:hypothetical protein
MIYISLSTTMQRWLQAHRRFHLHFTPTSSSWLNLVERFFGEPTFDVVREGSFQSARELVRAIESKALTVMWLWLHRSRLRKPSCKKRWIATLPI